MKPEEQAAIVAGIKEGRKQAAEICLEMAQRLSGSHDYGSPYEMVVLCKAAAKINGASWTVTARREDLDTNVQCAGCRIEIPLTVLCDTCAAKRS